MKHNCPNLGIGIGLRPIHYQAIFEHKPDIDWFEIISENFMVDGGKPIQYLHKILERYPVVQHGVSLAIGSPDPLDFDYLRRLKPSLKSQKHLGFPTTYAGDTAQAPTTMTFSLFHTQKKLSTMSQNAHASSKIF